VPERVELSQKPAETALGGAPVAIIYLQKNAHATKLRFFQSQKNVKGWVVFSNKLVTFVQVLRIKMLAIID